MHCKVHEMKPLVLVVSNIIERGSFKYIKGNCNGIRSSVECSFKDSDSCIGDACDADLRKR
jgi:hypothetical protein